MSAPDADKTKRKLRLTFEFEVPPGAPDVRTKARMGAVSELTAAMQAAALRELPWATSMTVRHEWMYAWYDETTPVPLTAHDAVEDAL
ncbi:hypothetical protein [Streptomyces sp. NPDC086519]|uniref:hypothetical protein n=1 Tax=Streptomyces sp. NPDC086519 TaxID=3154863 RepID=UPI003448FDDF